MKNYFCYIMASQEYGTLYIGVTGNLIERVFQHKQGVLEGFTKKHGIDRLVWYEVHRDIEQAIRREQQLKEWRRAWKYRLIWEMNPEWKDLYDTVAG